MEIRSRSGLCAVLWTFIVCVAILDIAFTWRYEYLMHECEQNPVAAFFFGWGGPKAVAVYRGMWVAFAFIMSKTRTRLSFIVLPVWTIAHALLLVLLIASFMLLR